jgi:hypothetical protein
MKFTPYCFVTTGLTGAMFTIRETYLHEQYQRDGSCHREVRSFHIQNLATTPDEALAKAQEIARSRGVELNTTREKLEDELRQIKRTSEAEMRARREVAAQLSIKHADQRDARIMRELTSGETRANDWKPQRWVTNGGWTENPVIKIEGAWYRVGHLNGCRKLDAERPVHWSLFLPHGKYQGKTLDQVGAVDRPYLEWLAASDGRDSLEQLRSDMVRGWLARNAAPVELNEYFGEVGRRLDVQMRVRAVKVMEAGADTYVGGSRWGRGAYQENVGRRLLVKGVDPEGRAITVWYSGRGWSPEVGQTYAVRGTVKKHGEYRGVRETTLTRVAVAEKEAS